MDKFCSLGSLNQTKREKLIIFVLYLMRCKNDNKKWHQNDVALTSVCGVVGQPIKVVISQGFN